MLILHPFVYHVIKIKFVILLSRHFEKGIEQVITKWKETYNIRLNQPAHSHSLIKVFHVESKTQKKKSNKKKKNWSVRPSAKPEFNMKFAIFIWL